MRNKNKTSEYYMEEELVAHKHFKPQETLKVCNKL